MTIDGAWSPISALTPAERLVVRDAIRAATLFCGGPELLPKLGLEVRIAFWEIAYARRHGGGK